MKFLLLIIIGLMTVPRSSAQNQDTLTDIEAIYGSDDNLNEIDCVLPIEKHPEFPGGQDSLFCFIENYWKGKVIDNYGKKGVVLVRFTVDSLGHVQDIEVNPDEIVRVATHLNFVRDQHIEDQVFSSFDNLPNWDTSLGNDQVRFSVMLRFPYEKRCIEVLS